MKELALLVHLQENARLPVSELAVMTGLPADRVSALMRQWEQDKVILGYTTAVNWEKTDRESVTGLIEVRVTPQLDRGFDHIARRIYKHPEVQSCFLISGSYDLLVIVEDESLKTVARFVSEKIAPLEAVVSTRTHFVLKTYKVNHLPFLDQDEDLREAVVL